MKKCFLGLCLLLLVGMPAQAQSLNTDSLDRFVENLLFDFQVPGMALGILRNDSLIYLQGYGTRKIGEDLPVDEHTAFGIGSISKSFTALTLAILVGEGKIDWDDRVREYLPYFELYDEYVSEHFTIRDLLTHQSGLKSVSGGTLWYHSSRSREEIIRGLKYLEPVSEFRTTSAYQNVMFMVAGEIVAKVSGMSWDDFLQTRLLDKLGMTHTTSRAAVREANPNLAQPHIMDEHFEKTAIVQEKGDNLTAAGFIYSSVSDMVKYMRLVLNEGVYEGDTLVPPEVFREILTPQVFFRLFPDPFHNKFTSYGFGWWLTPKDGHTVIEHSGGIDGMAANLMMIEDMDAGVIVLSNSSEPTSFLLSFKVTGKLLEDPAYELYPMVKQNWDRSLEEDKARKAQQEATRISGTSTSLALSAYTGTYRDQMYGDIFVESLSDGKLALTFSRTPLFHGELIHWHHDTFLIDWEDIRVPDGFLTFTFDAQHKILGFRIDQDRLLDVDFTELDIRRLAEE